MPDRSSNRIAESTTTIAIERVPSVSGRDRWLVAAAIVSVIAVASFMFGRQGSAPGPALSPPGSALSAAVAPATPGSFAPVAAPAATDPPAPLVRPAVVASELELAAAGVIAYGEWAVCPAGPPITCDSAAHLILTPAEARDARLAWSRLFPVAVSAGDVIVAAAQPGIAYALLISFVPGATPTVLAPIVSPAGIAYFDLGSDLPPGHYVVTIATGPNEAGLDEFEAAGVVVGP